MKRILNFIFCRWTNYEIYKQDVPYILTTVNHIINYESAPDRVLVDIYVKTNKYNGLKKYKRVIKYR